MAISLDNESSYAKRRQTHVALINQLRAIGAQAHLDLPRVVVIGNQSAGKSSLVEAISGITVPRDAGTCTRCPIECRMSEGPHWACHILIRWEFGDDGSLEDEVIEEPFGSPIFDKSEVELMLRRAQVAVLNPEEESQGFWNLSTKELKSRGENELQFSRNTICIDLSGPHMVDLAFVDLPGIIQNAEPEIVGMVENLVISHIKGNSVILVTLPMSDDIENQKALQLAKQADPSGSRTVGVLTKPDTITSGATKTKELWLDVIEGRRSQLKLGYYCTRQPDEDERAAHITQEAARAAEADFFASTAPWSHSTHRHRFGTQNLVGSISAHLVKVIDESLPGLMEETNRQLALCDSRLAAIPPVTTEPFSFVLELVQQFCTNMRAYIKGGAETANLVQKNSFVYRDLKVRIRGTAPVFVPYTKIATSLGEPALRDLQKLEDGEDDNVFTTSSKQIAIEQVQERIKSALTRELPNNVPYVVKLLFIKDFQADWPNIVQHTCDQVFTILSDHTVLMVSELFEPYNHLRPRVENAVRTLLEAKRSSMVAQTLKFIKYETTAYTQNDHYLSDGKEKFLAQYKALRAKKTQPAVAATINRPTPAPAQSVPKYSSPGTLKWPRFKAFGVFWPSPVDPQAPPEVLQFQMMCSGAHAGWSFEELRTTDYQEGARPPPVAAPAAQKAFQKAAQPFTFAKQAPAVGAQNNNASPFGGFTFNPTPVQAAAPVTPSLTDEERAEELRNVLEGLKRLGYNGVRSEDLQKLAPSDEYEEELALMAEVRAYFKVAYKRIIDYVPLAIDHELLYAFADDLQSHLLSALGINGEEAVAKCVAYLAEDPEIVAEREELRSRQKRLLGVKAGLLKAGVLME